MHLQVLVIFSCVLLFSSNVCSFSTGSQYRSQRFGGRGYEEPEEPADRSTTDPYGWLRREYQSAPHPSQHRSQPATGRASPTMQQRESPYLYRDPSSVDARQFRSSPMQGSWLSMQSRQYPQMDRNMRARQYPQMDRNMRARQYPQMDRNMQVRQSQQMDGRSIILDGHIGLLSSPDYWYERRYYGRESPMDYRTMSNYGQMMGRSMPPGEETSLPVESEFLATQPNTSFEKTPMTLTADHLPDSMVTHPKNTTHQPSEIQQPPLPQNTSTKNMPNDGDDYYDYEYGDDDDDDDDDNLIKNILDEDFEEDEDEERLNKLLDSADAIINKLRNIVAGHFQAHEEEIEGNNETIGVDGDLDKVKVKPETVVDKRKGNHSHISDGNSDVVLPSTPGGSDSEKFEAWREKCLGKSKFGGRRIKDDHCTYEDYLKQQPGSQNGTSPADNLSGGHNGHNNHTSIPAGRDSEEFRAWQEKCLEKPKFGGRHIIEDCSYQDYLNRLPDSPFTEPSPADNLSGGHHGHNNHTSIDTPIPGGRDSEEFKSWREECLREFGGRDILETCSYRHYLAAHDHSEFRSGTTDGGNPEPIDQNLNEVDLVPTGNAQTLPFELIAAQLQNKTKAEMTKILLDRHNAQPLYRQKMYLFSQE
ncbi:uncharacterized protein LOC111053231 isoform X2 [Nilaparvata lugens]|uniref:uncharacterized protein LOC111053231 isoform X2 n=1 Tax=Nilaparvata lugens TaxID=108931 RepID=UPI00193D0BB0|nr:uncharacterized protein LOC111053231 isoform X2 [Nilaparvata lugens]